MSKIKTFCSCGQPLYIGQGFKVPFCAVCDLPKTGQLEEFKNFFRNQHSAYGDLMLVVCEITQRPLDTSEVNALTDFLHKALLDQVNKCERTVLEIFDVGVKRNNLVIEIERP